MAVCLMAMAWQVHERYPLLLAANRDEFHRRPSTTMDWWPDGRILAGQDLEAGGTWLGLSRSGRIGLLTNVREPGKHREGLASRGHIVPRWLQHAHSSSELRAELAAMAHNGYNLLALDLARQHAHWWSNRHGHQDPLPAGVHGLSNAALGTPWPKLERLRRGVGALAQPSSNESPEQVLDALLNLLTDRHQPPDEQLPRTGVAQEWERLLGRIFIETPDRAYGTRCSTALVVERIDPRRWRLHAVEQGWDDRGQPTARAHHVLDGDFLEHQPA